MSLKIVALPAGVIRKAHGAAQTFLRNWDRISDAPVLMFAVLGGEHTVLVDTGTPSPELVQRYHGYNFERSAEEEPLAQLERAGIDPAEVGTVIWTHLHWDHCGNGELFPNAKFYVQAEELRYAVTPLEPNRAAYERHVPEHPPWFPVYDRLHTVTGSVEIAPGVTTVPLPGHSPGSQGVLVKTDAGRFLIAGDAIGTYQNWTGDGKISHVPSGSFTDLHAYMDSFARIETLDCEVIPSHDPKVLEIGTFG